MGGAEKLFVSKNSFDALIHVMQNIKTVVQRYFK